MLPQQRNGCGEVFHQLPAALIGDLLQPAAAEESLDLQYQLAYFSQR